jgi:hypothetical protein
MKKLALVALITLVAPLSAQQKQHGVYFDFQQGACPTGQTCSAVTQYNLYRAASANGPFDASTVIQNMGANATQVPCRAGSGLTGQCFEFNDQGGTPGAVYFYAITSADAQGDECKPSVTAAVTFPASTATVVVGVPTVH